MSNKHVSSGTEPTSTSPLARRFSEDFKRDSARLVTDERDTFKAAVAATGEADEDQVEVDVLRARGLGVQVGQDELKLAAGEDFGRINADRRAEVHG
ncbi:MAG: hypothetical protein EXS05_21395 [Planctomycetaceae bacterium]|nr:hypothetical protein [Planctomycetaceae bacterium]